MEERLKREQATTVFQRFCDYLKQNDWKFETSTSDDDCIIYTGIQGEDLPMRLVIRINIKRQLIMVLSKLPFVMPSDKRLEGAVATSIITNSLADGSFDYDLKDGEIVFRLTTNIRGGLISDETFEYLLMVSASTIDDYNDKLFMISKNKMSIDELYALVHNDNSGDDE